MLSFKDFVSRWGTRVSYKLSAADNSVVLFNSLGGPAHSEAISEFSGYLEALEGPAYSKGIMPVNPQKWVWDKDILHSVSGAGGYSEALVKFSWNPLSGDFIFIRPGLKHSSAKFDEPFDNYERGIILSDLNLVALRPIKPVWLSDSDTPTLISLGIQLACKEALELQGSKGWDWQFNITNPLLEQLTGYHRW